MDPRYNVNFGIPEKLTLCEILRYIEDWPFQSWNCFLKSLRHLLSVNTCFWGSQIARHSLMSCTGLVCSPFLSPPTKLFAFSASWPILSRFLRIVCIVETHIPYSHANFLTLTFPLSFFICAYLDINLSFSARVIALLVDMIVLIKKKNRRKLSALAMFEQLSMTVMCVQHTSRVRSFRVSVRASGKMLAFLLLGRLLWKMPIFVLILLFAVFRWFFFFTLYRLEIYKIIIIGDG